MLNGSCDINLNMASVRSVYFYLSVKMHALFSHTFNRSRRFVSQQAELCVFRCVASAAHFVILNIGVKK